MKPIDAKLKSLTTKLLAINVPMVSIALLILFSVLELQYYRTERAELVRSLHSLADLQSSAFASDVWDYDTDQIAVMLGELANLPHMQSAVVLDDSAAVLGSIGDVDARPEAPDLMVEQSLVYKTDQFDVTVGTLAITFHSGEIWKNVKSHLLVNALILAVMLATLIGVTLAAVRVVIVRPISRLLNSIERMRSERVLELVDWQSADELGRVVNAYNEMQIKHAEAEAALIEHQSDLEEQVASRTEELTTKERQFRTALDSMPGGMFMVDENLNFQVFNNQYKEHFGLPDDVLQVGGSLSAVIRFLAERGVYGPGDVDELIEQRLKGYTGRATERIEEALPDGRVIELERSPTDEGGTVVVSTVITERKRAEEELRDSERNIRQLIEDAALGATITDDTSFLFVNRAAMEMIGITSIDELTRDGSIYERVYEEDRAMVEDYGRRRIADEDTLSNYEFRLVREGGKLIWIDNHICEIKWNGKPAWLSWLIDITERKQAAAELETEQRRAEQFNKLTVGRELRMIEMKKDVDELLERLGEDSRYK